MLNKLGLWLLWALSNSLIIGLFPILINRIEFPNDFLFGLLLYILPQWLLVRFYFREPGWWILATFIGGCIALIAGILVTVSLGDSEPGSLAMFSIASYKKAAVGGATIGGAILGFAQWLVLRRYTTKASWWILFNTIAIVLGTGQILKLAIGTGIYSSVSLNRWIAICLASGLIEGTIKGGALVWLLQYPRSSSDRNY